MTVSTKYTFEVIGNQEDPKGNPLGYFRMTQGTKWSTAAQKYLKWKSHVVKAFNKAGYQHHNPLNFAPVSLQNDETAKVVLDIIFTNNVRADCDNVHKGILDSLFVNDKQVMEGAYTGKIDISSVGKVSVEITVYKSFPQKKTKPVLRAKAKKRILKK